MSGAAVNEGAVCAAGAFTTKFSVLLIWIELLVRNLKNGQGLFSPESRSLTHVFRKILKT